MGIPFLGVCTGCRDSLALDLDGLTQAIFAIDFEFIGSLRSFKIKNIEEDS